MRSSGQDMRIFKIAPTGEVLAGWPDVGGSYAPKYTIWPHGLVVDPSGRSLVLHYAEGRVLVFDTSNGKVVYKISGWVGEPGADEIIHTAVLSSNGRTLTVGIERSTLEDWNHYVVHLEPEDEPGHGKNSYERPRQIGSDLVPFAGNGNLKHNLYGTGFDAQTRSMARDSRGCTVIVTHTGVRVFNPDLTYSREVYAFPQKDTHPRWIQLSCVWFDPSRDVLFAISTVKGFLALRLV